MEEMVKKLDRKRSHGTVYGDPNVGYIQDEKYYRHDGTLYVPPAPAVPAAAPEKPPEPINPISEERRAAQSEAMKRVWAERREALAQQRASETPTQAP